MALVDDYCEVCGSERIESVKDFLSPLTVVWVSKCNDCGDVSEIARKSPAITSISTNTTP